MNKQYISPEITVTACETENVIATSIGSGKPTSQNNGITLVDAKSRFSSNNFIDDEDEEELW